MNNEEKKIQIELENQKKKLNEINSKKPLTENRPRIQVRIPRMISLNNVPSQGLNIPILERDLLDRLLFYSALLEDVEVRLNQTFSGVVNLGDIFKELHEQVEKNKFKIIKASRR